MPGLVLQMHHQKAFRSHPELITVNMDRKTVFVEDHGIFDQDLLISIFRDLMRSDHRCRTIIRSRFNGSLLKRIAAARCRIRIRRIDGIRLCLDHRLGLCLCFRFIP